MLAKRPSGDVSPAASKLTVSNTPRLIENYHSFTLSDGTGILPIPSLTDVSNKFCLQTALVSATWHKYTEIAFIPAILHSEDLL